MKKPLLFSIFVPVIFLISIYAPTPHFFSNQYDDSYITYRYAINLAQNHALVFNVGEHTDAASSFSYTVVLAILYWVGIDNLEFAGALIGVLSFAVLLFLVYRLSLLLTLNKNIAAFVSIACGINGLLSGWVLSGMETLPWAALVILAVYLVMSDARPIVIALVIALAAFTRIEGVLLFACYGSLLLTKPKRGIPFLYIGIAVFALFLFYFLKMQYYEVWISHAFKMKELASYYAPAPDELIKNWMRYASIPLVLAMPIIFSKKYFYVGVYISLSAISILLGPKSDWSRYSVHLLPLLYAFSSPVLIRLVNRTSFAQLVNVAIIIQALSGAKFMWRNNIALSEHQICRKEVGQYVKANLKSEGYIASADLGAISYMAIDHRFVDLIALTSADVLANYSRGETADSILIRKNVKYFASTFAARSSSNEIDDLLAQFPKIESKSKFRIDRDYLFSCKYDDLAFSVAKIFLTEPT